eukprot:6203591-Pleurochrysis_carterae.AAC.1
MQACQTNRCACAGSYAMRYLPASTYIKWPRREVNATSTENTATGTVRSWLWPRITRRADSIRDQERGTMARYTSSCTQQARCALARAVLCALLGSAHAACGPHPPVWPEQFVLVQRRIPDPDAA